MCADEYAIVEYAKELDVVQGGCVARCTKSSDTNPTSEDIVDMDLASCGRQNESLAESVAIYPNFVHDVAIFLTHVKQSAASNAATER